MDLAKATEDIRIFLLEAGEHALKLQEGIDPQYKKNKTIVTQADLDISKMAATKLAHYLEQSEHVLIDEESIETIPGPEKVFATTRYQWVLDPVDGTAGYALGRDRWAVSLGLLEEGVPVGGGFYMPAIGALVMVEGGQAWHTHIPTGEKKPMPKATAMDINLQVFVESFFGFERYSGEGVPNGKVWIHTPESGLQGGYSTLMLQAGGMTFFEGYSLWDIASIAAIAQCTGFKMMSLQDNNKTLERFSQEVIGENWRFKERWVMAHPDNYNAIREALTGK